MDRKALVKEVINRVKENVYPSEIVKRYVFLKRSGINQMGICPFHADHKIGSFSVNDNKKVWKCFSCGEAGDVVKFYSNINNMTYTDSAIKIAVDYGLLNIEEEAFLNKEYVPIKKSVKRKEIIQKEVKFEKRADDEVLDSVYRVFININKSLKKNILSDEHKNKLIEERKLSEEEIIRDMYFTFPTRHIIKHLITKLNEKNIDLNLLKRVPGFFFDKKKNSYSFMTVKGGGMGIPIINSKGLVTAIQIKKDQVEENSGKQSSKYIFFSSSFTSNFDYLEGGVGCGSPIYVDNNCKGVPCRSIFITEGVFKSKKITKEFNSISLSVQGVSSWKGTINEVDYLKKTSEFILDKIIIAYDSDMCYNLSVFEQTIKMGLHYSGYSERQIYSLLNNKNFVSYGKLEVKKEPSVYVALWDIAYGKGIDDMLINGHKKDIKKIDIEHLYNSYIKYKTQVYDLIGVLFEELKDIPQNVLDFYFKEEVLKIV